jgi:hypothetical protein
MESCLTMLPGSLYQLLIRMILAGLKLAWNFYWRWLGDDYKNGGSTKEGRIIRDAIDADGSERRAL